MALQHGMPVHYSGYLDIVEVNARHKEQCEAERNRALAEAAASRRRMEKMIRSWRLEADHAEAERRGIPYRVLFPERL